MDRHKAILNSFLEKHVKILNKKILDLSEVVIPQENYKAFRGKILGATNDMLRDLQSEIDKNYKINYDPEVKREHIIEVQPRISKGKDDKRGKGYGNEVK